MTEVVKDSIFPNFAQADLDPNCLSGLRAQDITLPIFLEIANVDSGKYLYLAHLKIILFGFNGFLCNSFYLYAFYGVLCAFCGFWILNSSFVMGLIIHQMMVMIQSLVDSY